MWQILRSEIAIDSIEQSPVGIDMQQEIEESNRIHYIEDNFNEEVEVIDNMNTAREVEEEDNENENEEDEDEY